MTWLIEVRTDLIKAGHKASDLDALPPPDPPAGAPAQSTSPTAGTAGFNNVSEEQMKRAQDMMRTSSVFSYLFPIGCTWRSSMKFLIFSFRVSIGSYLFKIKQMKIR